MSTKYNIGDWVYVAHATTSEKFVTCPDCLGKKFLTVILGDESRVTIDCTGCEPGGYQPPQGVIRQYEFAVLVERVQIDGVECATGEPTRYRIFNLNQPIPGHGTRLIRKT